MVLVRCRLSPVTCHMSLMPTATAKDPPPVNSPTMHSRMVLEEKKKEKWVIKDHIRGRIANSEKMLFSSL